MCRFNKRIPLVTGGAVVVALLAGAAFVAGQMLGLSAKTEAHLSSSGQSHSMQFVGDSDSGASYLSFTIEPAPKLPSRQADVSGLFVKREDNSLFVGTGDINVMMEIDGQTGEQRLVTNHSGPAIEIVTSRNTTIYRDQTRLDVGSQAGQSSERVIQQVVAPVDSLEEIGENTELQAWGERRGDRLLAEILVYRRAVTWVTEK